MTDQSGASICQTMQKWASTSQWERARTNCARVPWRDCSRHSKRTRSYSCAPIAQCCALRIFSTTSGCLLPSAAGAQCWNVSMAQTSCDRSDCESVYMYRYR